MWAERKNGVERTENPVKRSGAWQRTMEQERIGNGGDSINMFERAEQLFCRSRSLTCSCSNKLRRYPYVHEKVEVFSDSELQKSIQRTCSFTSQICCSSNLRYLYYPNPQLQCKSKDTSW